MKNRYDLLDISIVMIIFKIIFYPLPAFITIRTQVYESDYSDSFLYLEFII